MCTNSIKWVFFDLGSTLIDESDCYNFRIDEIVNANRIDKVEFVKSVLNFAKTNAFAIKAAAASFGASVPKWHSELEKLYPCVPELLNILSRKYRLGIIANQELGSEERLKDLGIKDFFDVIVTSAEAGCSKPDKKIFEIAFELSGCKPSEAIMVGDRLDNDIVPAKMLKMKTVWVKQGFAVYQRPVTQGEQPDFTINRIDELLNII